MGREKTQGFKLAATLIGVIVVVLVCIFLATARIDERLNQNAEQQVMTYTHQATYTISGRLELVFSAMYAFNIESEDLNRIEDQLQAFVDSYGFSNAYFANMDGQGITADGYQFDVDDLRVPETALSDGRYSYSPTFKGKDGSGARIGQLPLYIDGKQVGALYVEVPLSMFVLSDELALFNNGGYFVVFDELTGEIIDVPQKNADAKVFLGETIYSFLRDKLQAPEATSYLEAVDTGGEEEKSLSLLESWITTRQSGVLSAVIDGKPSYVAVVPVAGSSWYVCNIVPFENVRSEMGLVNAAFWFVFFIATLCLVSATVLTILFFQRRLRANHVAMEESLYAALSESIDMAVYLYCPADGTSSPIVAKSADVLSYPINKILDDPLLERVIDLSPDGREILRRVREGDIAELERGEFSLRNPETGQAKWAVFAVEPLHFDGKDQILIVLQDVTTERLVRECMQEAMDAAESANRAKSEFLSRMSHDIRTPMNVVTGMLQIAQKSSFDEAKVRVCLQKIGLASNQLLNIINEVLDFSKIESGKMALANNPFSLPNLIDDVANIVRIQCDQKGLIFLLDCDYDGVVNYEGDTIRLEQLMMNLLTNAVKYTEAGGWVSLGVHVLPEKVSGYRPVEFVISDNGIGMSKEFQETLFEPFTMEGRSQSQGTGLGMSIVKSVVMLMGGVITVESEIDKGTTFKVLVNISAQEGPARDLGDSPLSVREIRQAVAEPFALGATSELLAEVDGVNAAQASTDIGAPVKSEPSAEASAGAEKWLTEQVTIEELRRHKASEMPGEGVHILVVEDNDLNAEIACELLGMMGFTVTCAVNGQESVDMFQASALREYEVILMDVNMPLMDGYEATRIIRNLDREDAKTVIIMALSANAFSDDVTASLEAGMDGHLSKPMKVDRVVQGIYEVLEQRAMNKLD